MLKEKFVISVYLWCVKWESPSRRFPECKQMINEALVLSNKPKIEESKQAIIACLDSSIFGLPMEIISSRSWTVKYESQGRYDTILMCLADLLPQQFDIDARTLMGLMWCSKSFLLT